MRTLTAKALLGAVEGARAEAYGAEPRRSCLCTCGAASVELTLRQANAWAFVHARDGVEGSDHVVDVAEVK
jgi:hypothetical protein